MNTIVTKTSLSVCSIHANLCHQACSEHCRGLTGSFNSELLEINDDCISNIFDQGGDDAAPILSDLDEFYDHIPGATSHQQEFGSRNC